MQLQEAITILNDILDSNTDDKVKRKLSDIIKDLEDFRDSPERGATYALPDSVANLIPDRRFDTTFDRDRAGRLQQATLDMIYGKKKMQLPYILFLCTFLFTALGLAVPLICNKLDRDIWYFSIESAKDIVGIIFDGGGVACATAFAFNMNKAKSEFRGISGIILMFIGILGVVLTTLFAFLHPIAQGRVYYTIFEVVSVIFASIGVIITAITSSKKPKEN